MRERNTALTHEELVAALDYDAETGVFTWRHSRRNSFAGKKANADSGHGYIKISINHTFYYAHTLAWFYVYKQWPPATAEIDHISGDRSDNRIRNLRLLSPIENNMNRTRLNKNNTSGHRGVSWDKQSRKWMAMITVNRRQSCLGLFPTIEQAAQVRAAKFAELYRHLAETGHSNG